MEDMEEDGTMTAVTEGATAIPASREIRAAIRKFPYKFFDSVCNFALPNNDSLCYRHKSQPGAPMATTAASLLPMAEEATAAVTEEATGPRIFPSVTRTVAATEEATGPRDTPSAFQQVMFIMVMVLLMRTLVSS